MKLTNKELKALACSNLRMKICIESDMSGFKFINNHWRDFEDGDYCSIRFDSIVKYHLAGNGKKTAAIAALKLFINELEKKMEE